MEVVCSIFNSRLQGKGQEDDKKALDTTPSTRARPFSAQDTSHHHSSIELSTTPMIMVACKIGFLLLRLKKF
jgi:hypothetical protein